jgi:5-methylcytosine-specific restriction endonuclease McrA
VIGEELYVLYQISKSCDEYGVDLLPKEIEFDHIIALKNGGKHIISNMSIKCRICNKRKGVK